MQKQCYNKNKKLDKEKNKCKLKLLIYNKIQKSNRYIKNMKNNYKQFIIHIKNIQIGRLKMLEQRKIYYNLRDLQILHLNLVYIQL